MDFGTEFPIQTLSFRAKNTKWAKACVDWAANRTYFNCSPIRKSVVEMKINQDLVNGIVHMEDMRAILNPGQLSTMFIPDKIQHYPIINTKIHTLRGEEYGRAFEWHAVVTNPFSVSDIEKSKREQFDAAVKNIVEDGSLGEQDAEVQIQDNQDYFDREWQDWREQACNELLKHYSKEYNMPQLFNEGFNDALTNNIEIYRTGISGGEPVIEKLNPMKIRVYGSGYSNKIEDADVIVYEDYWSRGRIIDTFYDELSTNDIKWLSNEIPDMGNGGPVGAAGNYNEAYQFMRPERFIGSEGIDVTGDTTGLGFVFDELNTMDGGIGSDLLPYDTVGNVRVIRVWWKSRRKILKVKSYDEITGEEVFDFYPETYVPNEAAGEEAETMWVNQAWEGTKIGESIYVNMRPCLAQHNSISNPSRCHFGIIGTIYNVNESRPYSMVDMMKPYSYLYDAVHAKLVDLIATNWGKILEMDLAMKPRDWEVEKWMYFARANKVLIKDSFNEGHGLAAGKIAGGLNNASKGYIDADWGGSIQNYINILQWIKDSLSELVGINRQREGNTYSRETAGGIERAVLQSSYITDWLFKQHDDVKRRVLTAFLENAKVALRGRSKKFDYILSDGTKKVMTIDGDLFSESDYGIVIDNSGDTQKLDSQIETLAQAAIQNQMLDFSSVMRLYSSASMQEKMRIIDNAQRRMERNQQAAQQQQQQLEQQKMQAEMQAKQEELQQRDMLNQRDNETKLKIAEINSQAEYLRLGIYADENNEELRREEMEIDREKLRADIEQFDKELRLEEKKVDAENKLKEKELSQKREIELKKISKTNKTVSK